MDRIVSGTLFYAGMNMESSVTTTTTALHWRWLIMCLLTLALALFPHEALFALPLIVFSAAAALLKGIWIINDFMELKHAPPMLRRMLMLWLLLTTSAVTTAALWQS